MFTSTGSNFGAPTIQFKDYQNEHEIVLNAVFDYDADSDAYRNAKVLEIYVPELTLEKSAVTHVYFGAENNGCWFGTVVKAWIKNRTTICIEKFNPWPSKTNHRIWFCSMFATRGHRSLEFDLLPASACNLKHSGPIGYISGQKFIKTDNYVMLCFYTSGLSWNYQGKTDQVYNNTPFPDDIHVTLPYCCGLFSYNPYACIMIEVEWDGQNINFPALPEGYGSGTGYDPMFYAFAVRDGESASESNDNETELTV